MKYPVNRIFQTIQGEGCFTGVPAIFIRLQGCSVMCSWCDTKYTWKQDEFERVPSRDILVKTIDNSRWASCTEEDILALILNQDWTACHIVITGGEPCLYNLIPLTEVLEKQGFTCQIETSGTQEIHCTSRTWVTLSPKIDMYHKLPIVPKALIRSDEIKYPIEKKSDINKLDILLASLKDIKKRVIALQPVSQKERATNLCIETCILRNWRLSIQTQKYLKII
ncbi:organic radical activating enzyme [secondary endosymbiont of Heteropsylla cubana]|uniref:7-carboxy-7-deazaguanine synthase n=1 Tax=secondary endosymbiont of Heteropsylla cubana TaxID=134287 RepID=J3TZ27_9ENTR|nr:7-carboxy-7-deazaguanine synthase QueE [secondary endosymbiont of Heteropsylla cubana]AFP85710.1 organic radical activating enzyme [secondary endosymbiont of Heteropsylla cubana]